MLAFATNLAQLLGTRPDVIIAAINAAEVATASAGAATQAAAPAATAASYVVGGALAAAGLTAGGATALVTHNTLSKKVLEAQDEVLKVQKVVTALNIALAEAEQNLNTARQELATTTQKLHTATETNDATQQNVIDLQAKVNELIEQMALIDQALTIANTTLAAKEKELAKVNNEPNRANNPELQKIYDAAITQMALLKSKYEKNVTADQGTVEDLPSELQTAFHELEEATDKRISTEQALAKTFHEVATDISILRQNEEETAKADAEAIILKIKNVTLALKEAKNDKAKSQHEILLLETNLKALQQLRKEAFIHRAIKVYVRNMKKQDTYGGSIELQAIADIFNCDIQVWQNDAEFPVTVKPTINDGKTPILTLNITANLDQATGNTRYQPISNPLSDDSSLHEAISSTLEIPFDPNCLFVACIKAIQASKMQTDLATQIGTPYLAAAAYSLRLEVCEYLSNNSRQLYNIFENIIGQIYTKASNASSSELSAMDESIYNIIAGGLSPVCHSTRLLKNICKVIEQHYPEITDERIRAASNAKSISSDSSLEDIEDFDELDPSKFVLQDFAELDQKITNFFMGTRQTTGQATTENINAKDLSIARRYLGILAPDSEYIGGPIEVQAIAEMYNLHIRLEAFTRRNNSIGNPAYTNEFKKTGSKNSTEFLHVAIINADNANASFLLLNGANPEIDVERNKTDSIYEICCAVVGKSADEIKTAVYEHINKKVETITYNPFSATKQNDGVSAYFNDYIFKGYKGVGNELKEFDLLPEIFCNEAKTLRATRKVLFKVSSTLIEQLSGELAPEITEWTLPFNSLTRYNDMHLYPTNGHPHIPLLSMLLTLSSAATATANAVISENFTTTNQQTYNTLQASSLAVNLIGGVIFCLNNYIKEKNRSHAVRAIQDALIINLPFEKIDTSSIRLHKVAGNVVIPSNINDAAFDGARLRNEWAKDEYAKLSFSIADSTEPIFITKEQHIHALYKARNQHTIPIVALFMALYTILTPVTIVDVDRQIHNSENANATTSNNNETVQDSFSSPITANFEIAIALLSLITMIIAEKPGPKRVCEYELSAALRAISKSYAGNSGIMSEKIAMLLQYFNVNGTIADSFTTIPQMANIQKTIFKARQELKMHAQSLQQQIDQQATAVETSDITPETTLLTLLKDILTSLESFNIETLYQEDKISEVNKKVNAAIEELDGKQSSASQTPAIRRNSAVLFSSSLITKPLKRLSGVLKFSAAVDNGKVNDEKRPSSNRHFSFT